MDKAFAYSIMMGCLLAPAAPALASEGPTGVKPSGNGSDWVTAGDYPAAALRANAQGTTVFQLSIDAAGNVAGCRIVQSSGSPSLDDATCPVLTRRAHFSPATDADGRPTTGSYTSRIHWVMPYTVYRAPTAGVAVEQMIIEPDGKVTHCKASGASVGGSQLVYERCPDVHYQPYGYVVGKNARKLVTITSRTTVEDAPN